MEEPPPSPPPPQEAITETQSARQRLRETVEKSKERCPTELKFTKNAFIRKAIHIWKIDAPIQ
jgi:hypothetical protein